MSMYKQEYINCDFEVYCILCLFQTRGLYKNRLNYNHKKIINNYVKKHVNIITWKDNVSTRYW